MITRDIGIDLGTTNTLVFVKHRGVIFDEPTVVAVERRAPDRVLAIGYEAKKMLGKTPRHLVAGAPLREGVIDSFSMTEAMLRFILRGTKGWRSRVVISTPVNLTDVEQKAVRQAAESGGVRDVRLVEQPVAAALGAEIPIAEARGHMIVDLGGGTTDIGILSMGGLVVSESLKLGGSKLDEIVQTHVRRRHNLEIGEQTAEQLKLQLGSVAGEVDGAVIVKGRALLSGLPASVTVTARELRDALHDSALQIIEGIRSTLERAPPEIAADIADRGMVLTGGGAGLRGLPELIAVQLGVRVKVAEDPLRAVIRGVQAML